jgi:sarcosine oxidase subunit delta
VHRELWQHVYGCRRWLVVTRDTRTHAIAGAQDAMRLRLGDAAA